MIDDIPARLLALDASSTSIGYVLYDGCKAEAHGTVALKGLLIERLSIAAMSLDALLRTLQPDAVAYEGPAWMHRGTAIAVLQMLGVLRLSIHRYGIPDLELAPSEGKRALCKSGKADKRAMIDAAMPLLAPGRTGSALFDLGAWRCYDRGTLLFDEHAADALGIALAAHGKVRKEGVTA